MMEIKAETLKPCGNCGGNAEHDQKWLPTHIEEFVRCTSCGMRTEGCNDPSLAADIWNSRIEQDSATIDRWFKEATEQRARAELAEMQRDELAEALQCAKRAMAYGGLLQ